MKANKVNTRSDFITYLKQIGARFKETTVNGLDLIYVYDKKAYDNKKVFIPYIRVSHFDDYGWYVRDCGYVSVMRIEDICKKAWRLTRGVA